MNLTAPHLPPPACSLEARHKWLTLKWVVFIVFLSFAAGSTAALLMVDYFYPLDMSGGAYYFINRTKNINSPALDAAIVREIRYRLVRIYDEARIIQGQFYPETALVAQAVVLNAGGWSVMYAPQIINDVKVKLVGVDYQGVRRVIEKKLVDNVHGLIYLKLEGIGFRAATFVNRNQSLSDLGIWGVNSNWQPLSVRFERTIKSPFYPASEAFSRFELGLEHVGRILLTDRGDLVGFSDKDGLLLPAWIVEAQLSSVLESGTLQKSPVDWQGYMVEGMKAGGAWQEVTGFYIAESKSASQKNRVGKGDIVIKIQGEAVRKDRLAEQLWFAPKEFSVTVLRGGKEMDLTW